MPGMTIAAPSEVLTIRLPAAAAQRLHRVAEIARRPVDEVIAELLDAGLPPLLESVPEAMRDSLAEMETLSNEALWERFRAELGPEEVAEYDLLLEANAAGTLDDAGHRALDGFRSRADGLMFEKAYAALLLKWRGQHVPSLSDLEAAA